MIPVRDTIPSKTYPVVTHALIGLNVLFFLIEIGQRGDMDVFIYTYGLVPARYAVPRISAYFSMSQQAFSLISFMFLHGGFWHLLGNMWSLYIFGDNVEDHLGPVRYLLFYLLCGISSGLVHLMFNLHSNIPTIGASGAIAGVMGAYFILHPNSKILTLIPIFFIPYFVEIPAFFFLGLWFVLQFIQAAGSHANASGIAWWAHIGGFIFGIVFLKLMQPAAGAKATERMQKFTLKKTSPRLQVIRPAGYGTEPHLYGTLTITRHEAFTGTHKLINIPWGFQKRLFRVAIPPGIKEGNVLRLEGMGKIVRDDARGDLLLKVTIRP
ncbi:MAG: rhomboid family intramembrane serine protease [Desulfobacterales bacterium]|nr:rhomboid family intramembrane serine protease [Desulfobacterales bacterium]MDD4072633.1 rhomboid family intramembrane serine protease [Desulfobacterales bacterium]MDD4391471.1 rhomboid family intramembrane serine protease [Desulfobacterales bacterium]